MFRRTKKTRKYQAPSVKVTQMALESNFCHTVVLNAQSEEYEVVDGVDTGEVTVF